MIRQLAHICLGTRDLETTLRFYQEILGFAPVHEFVNDAGELYGMFLSCGGRTFLEIFNDQSMQAGSGPMRHVCFEVADIVAFVKDLGGKGIEAEIERGPTDGVLQAWVTDPDGNKVEFQQYDGKSVQGKFLERI